MKKSKKFVLAGLVLLAAITMVLLPLAGCKTEVDTSSPQQEQTNDTNDTTNTEDNTSGGDTGDNPSAGTGDNDSTNTEDNTSGGGDSGTGGGDTGDNPSAGNDGENGTVPETPAAKLVSISVTTPPTRTVYSVGQSFDPTGMVVTATYDDGEPKDVTSLATTDFDFSSAGVKTVTVSYSEGGSPVTKDFTVDVVNVEEPTKLTSYSSPNHTGSEWTYIAFGEWPQTIKDASVNVYESEGKEMGMFTYYLGSDGNHYVKAEEKANGAGYKYSNGEQAGQGGTSTNWFKVEPIVWRVLNKDYASTNKALLLAEKILTGGIKWGAVPSNNYMQSYIHRWLNGNNGDAGFLQTAFTQSARGKIADTSVDNSAASTTDKIFLLSDQEATNSEYGFGAYNDSDRTRIRVTTDYAKATGALQEDSLAGYGGWWWLRSPGHIDNSGGNAVVRFIFHNGQVMDVPVDFVESDLGVVPALSISLQ